VHRESGGTITQYGDRSSSDTTFLFTFTTSHRAMLVKLRVALHRRLTWGMVGYAQPNYSFKPRPLRGFAFALALR
jgi:hypothetical protein